MTSKNLSSSEENIVLFNDEKIRRERYNDERYFSVQDIVFVLTESKNPSDYIKKMKVRDPELSKGWGQIVTPLWADTNGGRQKINCTNTKGAMRIIQSIPSPNAEPFKQRLASLGNERVEESNDPELGIVRARMRAIEIYKSRGMTDDEIKRRISSIETRNVLTDEYQARGIVGLEYGILTNIGYGIFGTTAEGIKKKKGLGKHDNPRDHMNKTELLLTELTEETSKNLIKKKDAKGFNQIAPCVEKSVGIVKETKDAIESATGEDVLSDFNRLSDRQKELRLKEKENNKLTQRKPKNKNI